MRPGQWITHRGRRLRVRRCGPGWFGVDLEGTPADHLEAIGWSQGPLGPVAHLPEEAVEGRWAATGRARWRGEDVLVTDFADDTVSFRYLGDPGRIAELGVHGDGRDGFVGSAPEGEVAYLPQGCLVLTQYLGAEMQVLGSCHGSRLRLLDRAHADRVTVEVPAAECGEVWSIRTTARWGSRQVVVHEVDGSRAEITSTRPLPGSAGDAVRGWRGTVLTAHLEDVCEEWTLLRMAGDPRPGGPDRSSPALSQVRHVLALARVDDLMVLYGPDPDAPPLGPDHRWMVHATAAGGVVLGGRDGGEFATFARFADPVDAGAVLARLLQGTPPRPLEHPEEVARELGSELAWRAGQQGVGAFSASVLGVGGLLDHAGHDSGHVLRPYGDPALRTVTPGRVPLPRTGYRIRRPLPETCRVERVPAGGWNVVLDRVIAAYVKAGHLEPFQTRPVSY